VQAIQTLKQKNVTVIIITHRTSVLNCVDKLLVMQEGRLALFGPREKVVAEIKNRQMAAKEAQNNNKTQ
jgi:ATP-binding cassette subfamily C protein EexD